MPSHEDQLRDAYSERRESLRALGFTTYKDYLNSDLWASIRSSVLAKNKHCIGGCGRRATQVHHGRYAISDLDGRSSTNLYPVCDKCHRRCEFSNDRNVKLTPAQATEKLLRRTRIITGKGPRRKKAKARVIGGRRAEGRVMSRNDRESAPVKSAWRAKVER